MFRKSLVLVMVLVLAFMLAVPALAESEKEVIKIGFAVNESDESINTEQVGFKAYCDQYNASSDKYKIEYYITNAEKDVQKQIDDVNSLIELGCKAICLHSVDTEGLKTAVDACNAAKVYIADRRGMVYDGLNLRLETNDETAIAACAFEWFKANVMNDEAKVLKIGAIYGMATQTQQLIRVNHLIDLLKEAYGDRVEVVDSAYCDWDTQKSMEIMENWLQKYSPDQMNCILNASGAGLCGNVQAIIGFGGEKLLDSYVLQTTDANSDVLYYVYKGYIDMTVGLNPLRAGKISAEVLIQAITGEPGPHNFDISSGVLTLGIDAGGINAITKAEVDDWYDPASNTVKFPE